MNGKIMQIGFIGLGKMGRGLAVNLIKHGHQLHVYDLVESAVDAIVEAGAIGGTNPHAVAQTAQVLFTSLPKPTDVEAALLGPEGGLAALPDGAIAVDVSTIDPSTARKLADAADAQGKHFLACPLGKSPIHAAEGTEPIFAGGRQEVFESIRHLLEQIGHPVYYLGDVEQATAFKLISNLIGMTNIAVLAEGLALGQAAGIDPELLQRLLGDTGADSYQLRTRGPMILENDYTSRFSVRLTVKDLRVAMEMAQMWRQPVGLASLASNIYQSTVDQGYGEEDSMAIYKWYASSQ